MRGNVKKDNFTDADKEKVIQFLNLVAEKAKFEMNTQEVINYFKLLSFMQKELLPKIDSHIFEIKEVVQSKQDKDDL